MRFLKKAETPNSSQLTGKRLKIKKLTDKFQRAIDERKAKEAQSPSKTILRKKKT